MIFGFLFLLRSAARCCITWKNLQSFYISTSRRSPLTFRGDKSIWALARALLDSAVSRSVQKKLSNRRRLLPPFSFSA
ncbi:hypothetical protein C8R43DRAFT_1032094 [Mycena crocata]|nr:hypothetical protein C8R43DRAFT_1032094 [Mycena crocata]